MRFRVFVFTVIVCVFRLGLGVSQEAKGNEESPGFDPHIHGTMPKPEEMNAEERQASRLGGFEARIRKVTDKSNDPPNPIDPEGEDWWITTRDISVQSLLKRYSQMGPKGYGASGGFRFESVEERAMIADRIVSCLLGLVDEQFPCLRMAAFLRKLLNH